MRSGTRSATLRRRPPATTADRGPAAGQARRRTCPAPCERRTSTPGVFAGHCRKPGITRRSPETLAQPLDDAKDTETCNRIVQRGGSEVGKSLDHAKQSRRGPSDRCEENCEDGKNQLGTDVSQKAH